MIPFHKCNTCYKIIWPWQKGLDLFTANGIDYNQPKSEILKQIKEIEAISRKKYYHWNSKCFDKRILDKLATELSKKEK